MKTFYTLFFIISYIGLSAQEPQWIEFGSRHQLYPEDTYFIGFSMNKLKKGETKEQLISKQKALAIDELISTVQITVNSYTTQVFSEENDKINSSVKHASTSFSSIDLAGLKTESYYDKRKKTAYAFAHVQKEALIDLYQDILYQIKSDIAAKIRAAERYIIMDNEENALKAYYECMPLFREAESAYAIIILLRTSFDQMNQINDYKNNVRVEIAKLYQSEQISLDELCSFMSFGFKIQTGAFNERIQMGSFTYEDTKMSSAFSRRFINHFEKELIEEANYQIDQSIHRPDSEPAKYILGGTYWKDGDKLKLIAILRNMKTGKPIASAEGYLPLAWLAQREISFEPENFEQAAENMQIFKKK